ncbi:MAG: polyprenyl synthetase family protein, partial [Bacteroidales bacterium]|nr:polyprenyl synthetase family protein [Bacteroidales bacterium]
FLTAEICGGTTESTYTAAAMIELLHTATLIHDDVVDDSYQRRGFFSLNALWKNKIAVLVGDYLLSKGLLLSVENNEFEQLRILSQATKDMSEGELLQIEKARKLNIEEDIYFEIIRKKTASLISACCSSGAVSTMVEKEIVESMRKFGEFAGIAFQIKDDLFDYQQNNKTGKPIGTDLKEKKMTLPLIYALNNSGLSDRRKLINIVKRGGTNKEKMLWLVGKVGEKGGFKYAELKMKEYHDKALKCLERFPESSALSSLKHLLHFTITRQK